jgi:peptidoglycan DL-endopeptidase CwlO
VTGKEGAVIAVIAGFALAAAAHSAGSASASLTASRAPDAAAASAITYAKGQLGKPYIWGGTGPYGFDCSGLTWTAYQSAGVSIPRTSEAQWAALPHVSGADLEPGDLVFSYWDVDDQPAPNHVQMYVGGGMVVGADTTDVEETPLSTDAGHIVGYARP